MAFLLDVSAILLHELYTKKIELMCNRLASMSIASYVSFNVAVELGL
jgi:hypothetical protein